MRNSISPGQPKKKKKKKSGVVSYYLFFFFKKYWFYAKNVYNIKDVFSQKQQLLFEAFLFYVNNYQNNV